MLRKRFDSKQVSVCVLCLTDPMEFSLDADSPINTPVLPCTPDFYRTHCQQVKCLTWVSWAGLQHMTWLYLPVYVIQIQNRKAKNTKNALIISCVL